MFFKLQPPNLYKNLQKPFCQAGKLFSAEIWKMTECYFWANVMFRQSHVRASKGLSCSKVAGFEGGLFQKLFKGYIFCFLGHLVGRYIFELNAGETNLMKKRSVWLSCPYNKHTLPWQKLNFFLMFLSDLDWKLYNPILLHICWVREQLLYAI